MGSWAELWFNKLSFLTTKNEFSIDAMDLFDENEKHIRPLNDPELISQLKERNMHPDEVDPNDKYVYYKTNCNKAKDRLNLKGYTYNNTINFIKIQLEKRKSEIEIKQKTENHDFMVARNNKIMALSVDEIISTVKRACLLSRKNKISKVGQHKGNINDYFEDIYLWDENVKLRLYTEFSNNEDTLIYDLSDIVWSGYYDENYDFIKNAEEISRIESLSSPNILILTEGTSDTRILKIAIERLYPHLKDYISFLNFEDSKYPGGAGTLQNTIKAFAGANIYEKIIGLFDNDTAGCEAVEALRNIALPDNIIVMTLPNLDDFNSYPTIGPTGKMDFDINGNAVSIELFLDDFLLKNKSGIKYPIQWTGLNQKLKKYQGEITSKREIQNNFFETYKTNPEIFQFRRMKTLVDTLITAFEYFDGINIQKMINHYESQ